MKPSKLSMGRKNRVWNGLELRSGLLDVETSKQQKTSAAYRILISHSVHEGFWKWVEFLAYPYILRDSAVRLCVHVFNA